MFQLWVVNVHVFPSRSPSETSRACAISSKSIPLESLGFSLNFWAVDPFCLRNAGSFLTFSEGVSGRFSANKQHISFLKWSQTMLSTGPPRGWLLGSSRACCPCWVSDSYLTTSAPRWVPIIEMLKWEEVEVLDAIYERYDIRKSVGLSEWTHARASICRHAPGKLPQRRAWDACSGRCV